MKIAVASADGLTVAPSLEMASCLLVFPVDGDRMEAPERRAFSQGVASRPSPASDLSASLAEPLSAPSERPHAGASAELPEDLLRGVLDCSVVIAGTFTKTQQDRLQRLGLLPLPVLGGGAAETIVRFVVSGRPPEEGEACGVCPGRGTRGKVPAFAAPDSPLPVLRTLAK